MFTAPKNGSGKYSGIGYGADGEIVSEPDLISYFCRQATAEFIRLETETEMKSKEAQLNLVFEGALDAIAELDQDFGILLMNPSVRRLFDAASSLMKGG